MIGNASFLQPFRGCRFYTLVLVFTVTWNLRPWKEDFLVVNPASIAIEHGPVEIVDVFPAKTW